jgi:hypothetical protein
MKTLKLLLILFAIVTSAAWLLSLANKEVQQKGDAFEYNEIMIGSGETNLIDQVIAHWKFDEDESYKNDSMNNYDLSGDASFEETIVKLGRSASFDGSLTLTTDFSSFFNKSTFTFAGWVYLTDANEDEQVILGQYNPDDQNSAFALLYHYSSDLFTPTTLQFLVWPSRDSAETLVTAPIGGTGWHFVRIWREDESEIGIQVDEDEAQTTEYVDVINSDTVPFYVGSSNGRSRYFIGYMDEWSLWDRLLNSYEHTRLINNGDGLALEDWEEEIPPEEVVPVSINNGSIKINNGKLIIN